MKPWLQHLLKKIDLIDVACFPPIYLQEAPEDERVLASMHWGLIPSWFKGSSPKQMQYSTNNCRSENILAKKSYKVHTHKMELKQQCKVTETNFLFYCLYEGPHGEGPTLCHPGWWFLWVAEAGQSQAAFLHILPSDGRAESGQGGWTCGHTHQKEDLWRHVPWEDHLFRLDRGLFAVSCSVISITDSCFHLEQRSRKGSCGGNCHFCK